MSLTTEKDKPANKLAELYKLDPLLTNQVSNFVDYLVSCKNDKYEAKKKESPVLMDNLIFSGEMGTGFNVGNALRYLTRYLTTDYAKSRNKEDLYKAIHYLFFEYVNQEQNQSEPTK